MKGIKKCNILEKLNYNIGGLITGFHRRLNIITVFIPFIPFIPVNINNWKCHCKR